MIFQVAGVIAVAWLVTHVYHSVRDWREKRK